MDFESLARELSEAAKPTTKIDGRHTAQLLASARCLVKKLESPDDVVPPLAKMPLAHATLRLALRMKIFDSFDGSEVMTVEQISGRVGADGLLIARIMRVLASVSVFTQTNRDSYVHTVSSRALMDPTYRQLIICWMESTISFSHLPDYLSSIGYRNPDDPENSLFHYASGGKLDFFQHMQAHPDMMETFSKGMAASVHLQGSHLPGSISALFPSDSKKSGPKGQSPSDNPLMQEENGISGSSLRPRNEHDHVLLVDIGGGRGRILQDVRRMRPDLRGRFIVQDLAKEIDGRELAEGVECMTYNFMHPQPVRDASVYFFRHILHDWPDNKCLQILENTIPALDKNHSRIVIVDIVLPDTGAEVLPALFDINMMLMGGRERTEREWRELLRTAGLQVMKITGPEPGVWTMDSVIEAMIYSQGGEAEEEYQGEFVDK